MRYFANATDKRTHRKNQYALHLKESVEFFILENRKLISEPSTWLQIEVILPPSFILWLLKNQGLVFVWGVRRRGASSTNSFSSELFCAPRDYSFEFEFVAFGHGGKALLRALHSPAVISCQTWSSERLTYCFSWELRKRQNLESHV